MSKSHLSMRSCTLQEVQDKNTIVIIGNQSLCGEVKRFLIKENYIFKGFSIPGTNRFGVEVRFQHNYDIESFVEKWDTACKISSKKLEKLIERS